MTDTTLPGAPPQRDNLLGVCHTIGESFGFDPLYLRVAFVASILVNFELALCVYVALAVAVVLVRR